MVGQGHLDAREEARLRESLLAFWADAGVDVVLGDEPVNRLVQAPKPKSVATVLAAAPTLVVSPAAPAPIAAAPKGPDLAAAVAKAEALAASANTLEELSAAIAGFEDCTLRYEGARQSVFARGEAGADILIIGEGPGADEDVTGLPFVGKAGKLLDRMLAAASISQRAFITNTVYWRPPGNRTPTQAEQMVCRPFVERTIALVKPKVLLLAGGASAKSMLGREEGILSLRGRWFEWASKDGSMVLPALPTLHPAFLLRTPAAKKKAWSDLLTLTERVDRPERAP
jgi:uracil-DNA glycosylase family 4